MTKLTAIISDEGMGRQSIFEHVNEWLVCHVMAQQVNKIYFLRQKGDNPVPS